MTVGELIIKLHEFPENTEVVRGDYEMGDTEIDGVDMRPGGFYSQEPHVVIW